MSSKPRPVTPWRSRHPVAALLALLRESAQAGESCRSPRGVQCKVKTVSVLLPSRAFTIWPLLWAHLDHSGCFSSGAVLRCLSQKDQLAPRWPKNSLCTVLRTQQVYPDSNSVCALKGRRECAIDVLSRASGQRGGRPCETAFRGAVCMWACVCVLLARPRVLCHLTACPPPRRGFLSVGPRASTCLWASRALSSQRVMMSCTPCCSSMHSCLPCVFGGGPGARQVGQ